MSDLISRSALLKHVRICKEAVSACANHDYMVGYASALSGMEGQICAAPAVDAEPVRHGKWKYYSPTMIECSICKRHTSRHKFEYCPRCGASMEVDEDAAD